MRPAAWWTSSVMSDVTRHGKPVAQIAPVEDRVFTGRDLVELVRSGRVPSAGPEYARAVEEGIALFNRIQVPKSIWEP